MNEGDSNGAGAAPKKQKKRKKASTGDVASPRPKPQDLPNMKGAGVERPEVPALDEAVERYVDVRDRRMKLTEQEVEAKKKVVDLMHEHKLTYYEAPDKVVELKPGGEEKLKVKKRADYEPED